MSSLVVMTPDLWKSGPLLQRYIYFNPLERFCMVAPVSGLLVKPTISTRVTIPAGSVEVYRKTRWGYRQMKPYNLPLPTAMEECRARADVRDTRYPEIPCSLNSSSYAKPRSVLPNLKTLAYNDAYARLRDSLQGDAALGINFVQRKQAIGMMTERVLQLFKFARHVRRFEFVAAAETLNISAKRFKGLTLRKESKALGNNWLEFHFGWSPLVHDIYKAIDLLQKPIPDVRLTGSGSAKLGLTVIPPNPGAYIYGSNAFGAHVKVKIGTYVYVSNPNLWLANKMGVVNPAIIVWDAVPFSFVVDWFVNLNDVMSSWTDFAGLTLVNPWSSVFSRSKWDYTEYGGSGSSYRVIREGSTLVNFDRSLGIGSGPVLRTRKPWHLSVTRGATAIALLLQAMR